MVIVYILKLRQIKMDPNLFSTHLIQKQDTDQNYYNRPDNRPKKKNPQMQGTHVSMNYCLCECMFSMNMSLVSV